jgi:hypothetical protein
LQHCSKNVHNHILIKKLLGGVMLVVFGFSVTPKILLHNLVADHRDTPRTQNYTNEQQLSKTGFNCNCDNLVVESPFVNNYVPIELQLTRQFFETQIVYIDRFYSVDFFYFKLRGPPAGMLTDLS